VNGCFIESVAAARALVEQGNFLQRTQLVSFYFRVPGGVLGHTWLAYEERRGAFLLDPNQPKTPIRVGSHLPADPMEFARRFGHTRAEILKVRAVTLPTPRATALARSDTPPSSDVDAHLLNSSVARRCSQRGG
jgi:hypothetical protein